MSKFIIHIAEIPGPDPMPMESNPQEAAEEFMKEWFYQQFLAFLEEVHTHGEVQEFMRGIQAEWKLEVMFRADEISDERIPL